MAEEGHRAPAQRRAAVAASALVLVAVIAVVFSSGQGSRAGELVQKLVRAKESLQKQGGGGCGCWVG